MRRTVSLGTFAACPRRLAAGGLRQHRPIIAASAPAPGAVDKLEVRHPEPRGRPAPDRLAVGRGHLQSERLVLHQREAGILGPFKPWITEQSVIQITFNESGRVADHQSTTI